MCTTIILYRKDSKWPLIVGSNRDENLKRKSKFPGRHWKKNYPNIIGGLDLKAKGTWCAINDQGLLSIIHNRMLEKDNKKKKITRGKIILNILKKKNLEEILFFLTKLDTSIYNGFNLIFADSKNCYWAKHVSTSKKIEIKNINEGYSILSYGDLNDFENEKSNFYHKKFTKAEIPDPLMGKWDSWKKILTFNRRYINSNFHNSICFEDKKNNYGTKSSSLIALPSICHNNMKKNKPVYLATEISPLYSNYKKVNFR